MNHVMLDELLHHLPVDSCAKPVVVVERNCGGGIGHIPACVPPPQSLAATLDEPWTPLGECLVVPGARVAILGLPVVIFGPHLVNFGTRVAILGPRLATLGIRVLILGPAC